MKKILILYFSGVGATKRIAELMYNNLAQNCIIDIFSIENTNIPNITNYDALLIGVPTHHGAPPKMALNHLKTLPKSPEELPVFIYSTHGLTLLNTNRILSKALFSKNIVTVMDRAYRAPASDGTLITPFIKPFFEFEKNIENKLKSDCVNFLAILKDSTSTAYTPRFQLRSIINAPNRLAGQLITFKIHLRQDKCSKCEHCVVICPHAAFSLDNSGYPSYHSKDCENCYRCIHHCPQSALSLNKWWSPKKLLKY